MDAGDHLGNGRLVKPLNVHWNEPEQTTSSESGPEIKIGKAPVPAEAGGREFMVEIFTMTLGEEAIYLLPLKTWSQLDVYKWRVQGKLPSTPAGLEISVDHVKMGGQTISTADPEGCEKLERAFDEWLRLEKEALELVKQKAQATPAQAITDLTQEEEQVRFQVERDKTGQPHIRCLEGKETAANVALTVPGLNSLFTHGLMRQPAAWKLGALRNWIELDGETFELGDGKEDLVALEKALNDRYLPREESGSIRDVRLFPNPASPSGFDVQFPADANGLVENRRRHLDTEAMELLSDPKRCRVLRKGLIVKFSAPEFIFKQKTMDGGERHLDPIPENKVCTVGDDGKSKVIDLSQPLSHLGLSAAELTTIFNHPALNRRARKAEDSQETLKRAA